MVSGSSDYTGCIGSKHLFAARKPVFNPAAFGLFVSILLFHSSQSWRGGLPLLPSSMVL